MRHAVTSSLLLIALCTPLPAVDLPMPTTDLPASLTPPPPATPRITGPSVFGVRPEAPFLFTVRATGEKPMAFAAEGLPASLAIDAKTGMITGTFKERGEYMVTCKATNAKGSIERKLRVVVGDKIALTPPMGWNSWNCWAAAVDQEKVLRSAKALVTSGLADHGWTYVNIDDAWQGGVRGGDFNGIQPDAKKFPDMKGLCDTIHSMGLKAGIYSTPMKTSYAWRMGGSSDDPNGVFAKTQQGAFQCGKYSFASNDAKQWAAWGFDYLKYDWWPNDVPHTEEMFLALRASGRDVVFSLSNSAPFAHIADLSLYSNCWRTTGDIWDFWEHNDIEWRFSVSEIGFGQDAWAPFAGPGHWNDMDMLVVGWVGWGPQLHRTNLTADEQYTHLSLWCLMSSPLLIGCDLDRLDPFTIGLLSNDEVLAINQDSLGRQAVKVAAVGQVDIIKKELEDGGHAVGFFNRGNTPTTVKFNKLGRIGINGRNHVRDLWRQKTLPDANGQITVSLNPHGVMLYKFTQAKPGDPVILPDITYLDVTEKVSSFVKNNALSVKADHRILDDPAPGHARKLQVEYTLDNEAGIKTCKEGETILIDAVAGKKLFISKALFGILPDKKE